MKFPTLADVAERAGVSAKTVSNVILGRPHVAAATRERVEQAVRDLGYQANPAGRGLTSGRTGRIAVVIPKLYQPYFAEIAERLILALGARGWATTLRVAPDAQSERDAVMGVTTSDTDGVVICPQHLTPEAMDQRPPRPVVQVGGRPVGLIDAVVMGEREGFEAVTRHVLESGRRRIAMLASGRPHARPGGERYEGLEQAMAAYGLTIDPRLVVFGSDWDRRISGYEAMTGLLQTGRLFDAAICINDAVAIGALRALRMHGARVPEDVALTGFDDTEEGRYTTPSLTSVSPEQEQMVEHAVQMLHERLHGHQGTARQVRTGAHLVPRGSTG